MIFLYSVFAILIVLYEIVRKHKTIIDSMTMVNLAMIAYYIGPAIMFCLKDSIGFKSEYYIKFGHDTVPTLKGLFCVLTFYCAVLISRYTHIRKYNKDVELDIYNQESKIIKLSFVIIVACSILFIYYASMYGGIVNLLINSNLIRYGVIENSGSSALVFINKLFMCVVYAPILLFAYRNNKNKLYIYISFFIAILIVLSTGSRGELFRFLFVFILGNLILKNRKSFNIKQLIIISVVGYFVIILFRPLLSNLIYLPEHGIKYVFDNYIQNITSGGKYSIQSGLGLILNLTNSFEHYFVSLETSIRVVDSGIHDKNYIIEFFIALSSIIPSQLIGIAKPDPIVVYNSMYISGGYGITQIPAGVIAASYYGFGIVGPFLYGFIIGKVGRAIDRLLERGKRNIKFIPYFYVYLLFVFMAIGMGGDISSQFANHFTGILIIILLLTQFKRKPKSN